MRTTIIPAQITTVEDRIAGNLSLSQILLLLVPILTTTAIYAYISPTLSFTYIKIISIAITAIIFVALAVRIRGMVVFQWLLIMARYCFRPKYYLCNKNDTYLRSIDIPNLNTGEEPAFTKTYKENEKKNTNQDVPFIGKLQFEQLIHTNQVSDRFSLTGNGQFNVALEKIK